MATDTDVTNTTALLQQLATLTAVDQGMRGLFTVEKPRRMRARGFDWDHEVRVALPISYSATSSTYPVLWLTDPYFELAVALLESVALGRELPELILVNVGPDTSAPVLDWARRRVYDFTPDAEVLYDGPGAEWMRAQTRAAEAAGVPSQPGGGAGDFLDFMVDTVRPQLAAEYRMDPDDNCLFGHSGGGMFAGFALFSRPEAFSRYIIGSPSLYGSNQKVFTLEEEYAAHHDDLKANIFFGGSTMEIVNPVAASWSIIGSMIRLAELLAVRSYPSTTVTVKLFPDESHLTVIPSLLLWGIRTVWAERIST